MYPSLCLLCVYCIMDLGVRKYGWMPNIKGHTWAFIV